MKQTIIKLIHELRNYILAWLVMYSIVFIFCFIYREQIYTFLVKPLKTLFNKTNINDIFVYTSIFEQFTTDIMLSLYSALFLSLPLMYLMIYKFIAKSLYRREKKVILPLFIISFLLITVAIFINYKFLFPHICTFFLSLQTIAKPMLKISDYVFTFFHLSIMVGFIFQYPIILVVLKKFGFIDNKFLVKNRKISIVIIFIISALITPPDIFSQILVAIVLITIYEITNLILKKM